MTTSRMAVRVAMGVVVWGGFAAMAVAQPPAITVDFALKQQPRQPGVNVNTPTPDQAPRCKVTPLGNPKVPGYLVTDPDGKPVRQFVSYDNKNYNIIAFYIDGVEAYREVYPPATGDPYQFRWLGPNGGKWGLDRDRDGRIDEWVVISPEEVSQELLTAVMARDTKRLEALLVTKENLASIGLPAAEVTKIRERTAAAAKRLVDTAEALKLSPQAKWVHAEFGIPFARPADSFDGRDDHTVYKNGSVLVEDGTKTHFLQTGELIQVGRSWKLVDGPSAGPLPMNGTSDLGSGPVVTPEIKDLVAQLNDLDKQAPNPPTVASLAAFNVRRADLLEQIVAKLPDDKKEAWVKMLIDSHAGAAEGDKPGNKHIVRLQQWRDTMTKAGNPTVAAYAAFRYLTAENSVALANIKDASNELGPIQDRWRAGLEEFIKNFPKSSDTPEAVLRLAMAYELSGAKDAETKARQWFDHLVKNYADHPNAAKAAGAIKRFDCEGKPLELSGPVLGTGSQFNAATQKDKVIVVYYWASWSRSLADDSKKLQSLVKDYGPKGLVVVTVSLDHEAKQAADTVRAVGLPGTHLHAPGGLDGSPLAASYGILVAPHIFIAGKDGKVTDRSGQIPTLEEDVKKLLEK